MVPKLHSKGSSFKGAAQYLLHDKGRAQSSERVAWTETRNLAVDDPEIAWRIMAATAIDQARLKEQAGVKNTGRKSDKHVLHFTLAWHPDQEPTREEMSQAADTAIAALGGSDRQAMVIAHNDQKHSHVHIILNRVSPTDGRHLSSSKEKLKLSEWAQGFEEDEGKIRCKNREHNNNLRKNGEYVRGQKDKSKHIFEDQVGAAANDNDRGRAVAADQRKKDHALALRSRNTAEMQKRAWSKLADSHRARKTTLARSLRKQISKARDTVREEFRPKWIDLNQHQRSERETFDALELKFWGRASNIAKAIKLSREDIGDDKSNIIIRAFNISTNEHERRASFARAQERARAALQREQAEKARLRTDELKRAQEPKMAEARAYFFAERQMLEKTQAAQNARLQAVWKQRNAERSAQFDLLRRQAKLDEASKLEQLLEKRELLKPSQEQDNKPPAPDQRKPSHTDDFNQLQKEMREQNRNHADGQSQSDGDMDI